jgi:hypothetical protein
MGVLGWTARSLEMNQTLKDAIREVEALPEADQEELAHKLLVLAERKRIDALLAAAEERGAPPPIPR